MKISTAAVFTPVTLLLETQEEVDALYAILNNTVITEDTPFDPTGNSIDVLRQFASGNRDDMGVKLRDRLRQQYGSQ